jgi:hypothetical protein
MAREQYSLEAHLSTNLNNNESGLSGEFSVADLSPERAYCLGQHFGMACALMMITAKEERARTFCAQTLNRKRLELEAAKQGLECSWRWIDDDWGNFSIWKTPGYLRVTRP